MIPSILSSQVRKGVEDFLTTTFPISTPFFHGAIDRLIDSDGGLFKGPYISIKLPFRAGKSGPDFFADVPMAFPPHQHQEAAFVRLSGESPRSTIVATGTGSGKTECFLYPILNHCKQSRKRGQKGIKAIIIYPMNALATDQAKRIAKIIHQNSHLNHTVTAGLFIGQKDSNPAQVMTPEWLITDRNTLRLTPPDILLTNYKMLDYLLVRPKDYPIWQDNLAETLKYLVVDELHTFDGAQGTDLACLIRRIKARLKTPERHLCGVGTSATLGGLDDSLRLRDYAEQVFGETFDADSVITESLVSADEFLANSFISRSGVVPPEAIERLRPENFPDFSDYLKAQYELWFDEPPAGNDSEWLTEVGTKLRGHGFFWKLLLTMKNLAIPLNDLVSCFDRIVPEFTDDHADYRQLVMASMIALISAARIKGEGGKLWPFLNVRYQLWLRELRRLVCSVGTRPQLKFSDDLKAEELPTHMPVVHCRECGAMGWGGLLRTQDIRVNPDLQGFYQGFFNFSPTVVFLFPNADREISGEQMAIGVHLCPNCLNLVQDLEPKECPCCSATGMIAVLLANKRVKKKDKQYGSHDCPFCEGSNSLTIVGSRAASLTSVVISQLFASTYNDDKKLLTFSDSVQDASHRAGFFAARTYRFNLRTAIQKVVDQQERPLSLCDLPGAFVTYWSKEKKESDYLATFLPPDLEWLQDYESLVNNGTLPQGSDLPVTLRRRLAWEITSEYGFNCRIGRTLEKTSVSSAVIRPEALSAAVDYILEPLRNEVGGLQDLAKDQLARFLLGILMQMKNKGAIFHPELDQYINDWGGYYLLNRQPTTPNFGKFSRTPVFLTSKRGTRFDALLSSGSSQTWYETWLVKSFNPLHPGLGNYAEAIYKIVLDGLVSANILGLKIVQGFPVWGLNLAELLVEREVKQFRCTVCGHLLSAAGVNADLWPGNACLRFKCRGQYQEEPPSQDFYGTLYKTGDVKRIFAHEHTGLLARDTREALERRFIAGDAPGAPNLLSCTPTLEMGIDIGDLSSAVLCSVPPAQANYLQRIGRTGRRDGNSFNFTVAVGRPHDLYFFSEPQEMLTGQVEPPGCFLDAPAVLERQITAFCFDRWLEAKQGKVTIPDTLSQVLGNIGSKGEQTDRFPYNFIRFVEEGQDAIVNDFSTIFGVHLTKDSADHLAGFVKGKLPNADGLKIKIIKGLVNIAGEVESLKKRVQKLTSTIKQKEKDPAKDQNYEKDLNDLKMEKSSLHSIIRAIKDKNTFNFFTDEGLLPNYAFPEAEIILRSIIYRKKAKPDQHGQYDTKIFEYERPAASAIHELAPDNRFYAEGRAVQVDQINMNLSEIEEWRFCGICSYHQLLATAEETTCCPRCGNTLWGDDGQKRRMVKMRQVIATTNDSKSRSGDDSDDREPEFFSKKMLVDIPDQQVLAAFKVGTADFPFGIDFIGKGTFREVNFGKRDEMGEKINIAGEAMPLNGFLICRECGKVQGGPKDEERHAFSCSSKTRNKVADLLECLYLYRDFSSEAIRILLPVAAMEGADKKLHSFISALYIGLREKFKGNIDHLRTTLFEEPQPDSACQKKYLVLYDTVPGGTGYLKQLMHDEKPLLSILSSALDILQRCSCNQSPDKDGCYRCIYAYRNNFDRKMTSRNAAISILSEILAHRDGFVPTKSLKDISLNPLFESELESLFIETVKNATVDGAPVQMQQEIVHGKPGWFCSINGHGYLVVPQVEFEPSQGVAVSCRADFVFYPEKTGKELRPVVVFTDGFSFHVNRIGKDMAQRMALSRAGYRVWSISWEDVDARGKGLESQFDNYTQPENLMAMLEKFEPAFGVKKLASMKSASSLDMLLQYLACPNEALWKAYALVQGLARIQLPCQEEEVLACRKMLSETTDWQEIKPLLTKDGTGTFLSGLFEVANGDDSPRIKALVSLESDEYRAGRYEAIQVLCRLFDDTEFVSHNSFRQAWNGFIRMYNLFQFLPGAIFIASSGVAGGGYSFLSFDQKVSPVGTVFGSEVPDVAEDLKTLLEVTDPILHPLLTLVYDQKLPLPEAGYELCNDNGKIVASGELCWPVYKLALLRDDEMGLVHEFTSREWEVMQVALALIDMEACLASIGKRTKS